MATAAEVVLLLRRVAELMGIVSLLPLLSSVKFSGLLEANRLSELRAKRLAEKEEKKKLAEKEEDKGDNEGKSSKNEAKDDEDDKVLEQATAAAATSLQRSIPSTTVAVLLLLAEICSVSQMLCPSDQQVRRAVSEVARAQSRSTSKSKTASGAGTFTEALSVIHQLIQGEDVLELVRFLATVASLGALIGSTSLGLMELDVTRQNGPIKQLGHSIKCFARILFAPRLFSALALGGIFLLGHWAFIVKIFKRPGTLDLVRDLAGVLRASAATVAVRETSWTGPMPAFAATQACAAVARAARIFAYERISWSALLAGGVFGSGKDAANVAVMQSSLLVEAWSVLWLLPAALYKRHFLFVVLAVCGPCVLLAAEHPLAAQLDPYVTLATERIVTIIASLAFMTVMIGGIRTMIMCVLTLQVLANIHSLHKMRI